MQNLLTNTIQLSKNRYIEKDTGYLICENAVLGSTDDLRYRAFEIGYEDVPPNTIITMHRPEQEIFAQDSLASLENKAFVIMHPQEDVTAQNDSELRKGNVFNVRRDGNEILGTIQITNQSAIKQVNKMNCLSLGYHFDYDKINDTELSIKNIRYNHLALVPRGRAKMAHIADSAENEEGEFMSLFSRKKLCANDEEMIKEDEEEKKDNSEAKDDLIQSGSKEAVEKNTKTEIEAGKSPEQAYAIAKSVQRENKDATTPFEQPEQKVATDEEDKKSPSKEDKKEDETKTNKKEEEEKMSENEKSAKDGLTLFDIDKIQDASIRATALDEYRVRNGISTVSAHGNDTEVFKPVAKDEQPAIDPELERKNYYRNTLNPHKNPNWKKECVNLSDVL